MILFLRHHKYRYKISNLLNIPIYQTILYLQTYQTIKYFLFINMHPQQYPKDRLIKKQLVSMTKTLLQNWQLYLKIQKNKMAAQKNKIHQNLHTYKSDKYITPYHRYKYLNQNPIKKSTINSIYIPQQNSRYSKIFNTPRTKLKTDYADLSQEKRQSFEHNYQSHKSISTKKFINTNNIYAHSSQKQFGIGNNIKNRYISIRQVTSDEKEQLLKNNDKNVKSSTKIGNFKKHQKLIPIKQQDQSLRTKYLARLERLNDSENSQSKSMKKIIFKKRQND